MSKTHQPIGDKFRIVGGRLGVGNFGEVRLGIDTVTKKRWTMENVLNMDIHVKY